MRRPIPVLVAVAALAVTGVVCAVTLAASVPHAVSAVSQAQQARVALLRLSDFPSGWRSEGRPVAKAHPRGSNATERNLAACLHTSSRALAPVPTASGAAFSSPTGAVDVTVAVQEFPSGRAARALLRLDVARRAPACLLSASGADLASQVRDSLPRGSSVGTPSAALLARGALGAASGGLEVRVPIDLQGSKVMGVSDTLFVRRAGGLETITVLYRKGTAGVPALERRLADEAAMRLD